jgi:autotransporter-associated beta strand protein
MSQLPRVDGFPPVKSNKLFTGSALASGAQASSRLLRAMRDCRCSWWSSVSAIVISGGFLFAGADANGEVFYFEGNGGDTLLSNSLNWKDGKLPTLLSPSIVIPATLGGTSVDAGTSVLSYGALRVTSVLPGGQVVLSTSDPDGSTLNFPKLDVQTGAKLTLDGSNPLILQGGGAAGIDFNSGGDAGEIVLDAVLSGGPVRVSGGTVVLNQRNTYAGVTTVNAGRLVVGTNGTFGLDENGNPLGNLAVKGGSVEVNNFSAVKAVEISDGAITGTADLAVESSVTANVAAGKTALISAKIADGGANPAEIYKTGEGRLILSGENIYSGTSNISGGVVEVASSSALGDSMAPVKLSGGTLAADRADRVVANPVDLSGPAQLGETGSGKLTLSGGVKVAGDPLSVVGEVEVSGVGLDAGERSGSLVFNGPGKLVLSEANTHTGTTVNGGILEVKKNLGSPTGTLIVNGGAVNFDLEPGAEVEVDKATITGGRIDGSTSKLALNGDLLAAVAAGTASISVAVKDGTTAQALLTKTGAGRLVLSGENEYTGATTIKEGVVEVASAKPFGDSPALVYMAGGTLTAGTAAREIRKTVEVQTGRSTVGGESTDIKLSALTFQPGAAVNINGRLAVAQRVDLNGGTIAFGTGKTNGATLLKLENGMMATTASTISFTKDTRIQVDGGAGQKVDLSKVQLAVSPEALADAAQNLRVGSPVKSQVLALLGGAMNDITVDEAVLAAPLGATAAVDVSFEKIDTANAGPLVAPGIALQFTRNAYQSIAQTANAKSFAAALDLSLSQIGSASPVGQLTKKLDAIVGASGVEYELRAANSAPMYASMYTVATRRSLAATAALDSHLDGLAAAASGEAVNSLGVAQARSGANSLSARGAADNERQWTAWVSGYSTESNLSEDAPAGFGKIRSTDTGGSLGVERKIGDLRVGLIAATGQADASFDGGGKVDTDHWHAGSYASVAIGAATVDASAVWGSADNTGRRPLGAGQVRSAFSSNDTQLGLGLAFNLAEPSNLWQFTPVARLKYLDYTQDAFTETGAGFLQADKMSESTWLSKLGIRFSRREEAGKKISVGLDGGAYWMHDYSAEGRQMNLRMTGTNASFSARGRDADADFVQVNAGVHATFSSTITVRMGWQQDFGGNRSQGTGIVSCSINF